MNDEQRPPEDLESTVSSDLSGQGPQETINKYRLLQKIGEGGMGEVWLADQQEPVRRRVAVKIIKRGMDTQQVVARFEAERQALAMMNHPNIAKVFDAGETADGRPFFVMEYIKGVPITEHCDRQRFATHERLVLFTQVCEGVQHAHQKAIIHRDLKPSNVLVTIQDEKPVPKIIDFGVAKAIEHRLTERTLFTELGQIVGTPEYMSPEQAEMTSQDIDTRTDVYSLGVMLYELLVGALPFDPQELRRAGFDEIRRKIREDEPSRPSTRVSTLDETATGSAKKRRTDPASLAKLLRGDLDWITMRALEKDRTRRYGSPQEMAADIRRHLSDEPVLASPPSVAYRARKFVRRHAVGVGFGVLLLGLLVVVVAVATLFGFREARLRREATWQSYVANVSAANASYRLRDIAEAKRRLSMCPQRLRGWEWFYLENSVDKSQATLFGHEEYVRTVAFSPDGRRVASGSDDHTIRIWDAASGELLQSLTGFGDLVLSIAFSPDGTNLASGNSDGVVRLWDVESSEILRSLVGHENGVWSVAFSPAGDRIASSSTDETVRLWDAASGEPLATLKGHDDDVWSTAFSPDGEQIASASGDKTVVLWDAKSGEVLNTLEHELSVHAVGFSPDGKQIVSGCSDNTVRFWDTTSGELQMTLWGHDALVRSIAFSPDGTQIASGSWDKTVRLWDVTSGGQLATFIGHDEWVASVAFSPDGTRIASASGDKTVRLWDTSLVELRETLAGHEGQIKSVAFSPDGTRIASGSSDNTVRLWDGASGELLATLAGHYESVTSVAFSPNGTRLASGSVDSNVRLWDAASGELQATLGGHALPVTSVAFSPDGTRLVSGSDDKTIRIWDAASGELARTILGQDHPVTSVAFSPDGTRIASAFGDKSVYTWDALSGEMLATLVGHEDYVVSVTFSPDGTRIVSGSGDETARLWDTESGELLATLVGHEDWVNSVAFNPDGTRIVTAADDNSVRLWDTESGELLATLVGHEDWVNSVAFSPDGTRICSGADDMTLRIWDSRHYRTRLSERQAILAAQPEAKRIVERLWQQHSDANQVAELLREDASLSEPQRRAAANLLLEKSSKLHTELSEQLKTYFARLVLTADVVAALTTDASLAESVRHKAIKTAEAIGDNPTRIMLDCWMLLRSADNDQEAYDIGLRGAEVVAAAQPDDFRTLGILGIAQYRNGQFEDAYVTSTRWDELAQQVYGDRIPPAVALRAMALSRLDRHEDGQAMFAQLDELMKGRWKRSETAMTLFEEAKLMFSASSTQANPLERLESGE